jgi:hypothetical protein
MQVDSGVCFQKAPPKTYGLTATWFYSMLAMDREVPFIFSLYPEVVITISFNCQKAVRVSIVCLLYDYQTLNYELE